MKARLFFNLSSSANNVSVMLVGVAGLDEEGVFKREEDFEPAGDISVLE